MFSEIFDVGLELLDWRIIVPSILVCGIAYWLYHIRRPGLPPGPFPLPVWGNLNGMNAGPVDKVMENWRKQYGDVFMIFMGPQRGVVISGLENIKSFYVQTGDEFVNRPPLHSFAKYSKGFKGIMLCSGQLWRENRSIASAGLRNMMGAGRQSLQDKVIEEATVLREELLEMDGKPLNITPYLNNSVVNVIYSMVFGQRFERGNPELDEMVASIRAVLEAAIQTFLLNYLPWLRFFPNMPTLDEHTDKLEAFVTRKIAEHRETFDPSQPPRDFVDFFLKIEHDASEDDDQTFDKENISVIIKDIFFAGGDTIVTTMRWGILFFTLNPDVQTRCREEIHEVLGKDGNPDLATRGKLPYLEASILEIQRLGDIVPLNDPRFSYRDAQIGGFFIPKGTAVMPFMTSIHRSAEYWEEPDKFRPDRWLDSEGKLVRHEALIPFSLGRRNCIGEHIARLELFTFFTMLLQQLWFSAPEDQPAPSIDGVIGMMRTPEEYQVIVRKVE